MHTAIPSLTAVLTLTLLGACGSGDPSSPRGGERGGDQLAAAPDAGTAGAAVDPWWSALPRPAWAAFPRVRHGQGWFEVYYLDQGVYAIYEPGQFEEVISFLILGDERALLFDTGLGIGDIAALVAELTDLPVRVLNSHSHYDHIGGNHQFDDVWALDHPFSRAREEGLAASVVSEAVAPDWIWQPLPQGFDPGSYAIAPYRVTRRVRSGDVLELGGRRLEVLATPGHAPDSLCLLDRDNGLLFTGDTFYPAPLYTHLDGADFDAYRDSARRLAELAPQVERLITSHNVPVADAGYLLALTAALEAIAAGTASYRLEDGLRRYAFDGFAVLTNTADLASE